MKLRHAAALALVGWYLVFPHTLPHSPKPDLSKPISEWSRVGPVVSKSDCEARRLRSIRRLDDPAYVEDFKKTVLPGIVAEQRKWGGKKIPDSYFEQQYFEDMRRYLSMSQCVSEDDPRLTDDPRLADRPRLKEK